MPRYTQIRIWVRHCGALEAAYPRNIAVTLEAETPGVYTPCSNPFIAAAITGYHIEEVLVALTVTLAADPLRER